MSREFINGQIAEKAKIASQLITEVLAEMPDAFLKEHQANLSKGSQSLLAIHHTLRQQDKK
jgi:hypothetical protein